ncbi:MAG: AAA family ATPase [Pseudomonadota bacterium]
MTTELHLKKIAFEGPNKQADVEFSTGVNVICGASDTGKSYLAETIDFMLGGMSLRQIPERTPYAEILLDIDSGEEEWRLTRPTDGGNFKLENLSNKKTETSVLKQKHSHGQEDNISGFLLSKSGLLSRRILKSAKNGTTQSLSFRNLARLIVVEEGEIQRKESPFLSGQFTSKTSELATLKMLLTGIDDSHIVADERFSQDTDGQITLINELIAELEVEVEGLGETREDLADQLQNLRDTIDDKRDVLSESQRTLNTLLSKRRKLFDERQSIQARLDEIENLLVRFVLLGDHYHVDLERLKAIQESGSMFAHVEPVPCPLCGAEPNAQHLDESCDGDVEAIIAAATAEVIKTQNLQKELKTTVNDLRVEYEDLDANLTDTNSKYDALDEEIQEAMAPEVNAIRASFSELIEKRSEVEKSFGLFKRLERLEAKRATLVDDENETGEASKIASGLPDAVAHQFSLKVSKILEAWNFPGDCLVHFDKERSDFIIDGKPRGSRGKGLRAITHAAITLGLMEYCQENDLAHPGFVVMDSPLLAYFKPEGDEDEKLKGSDLKERFYEYLTAHHKEDSQVIIIENQHPPEQFLPKLNLTIFTRNPNQGRQGLL